MLRGRGCLPLPVATASMATASSSSGSGEFRVITSGLSLAEAGGTDNRAAGQRSARSGPGRPLCRSIGQLGDQHHIPRAKTSSTHTTLQIRRQSRRSGRAVPGPNMRIARDVCRRSGISSICARRYAAEMEFSEVVRRRRMVRHYDPAREVSRDQLQRVAAAAQKAPSAGFSQGQRIVIVTDQARRERIAAISDEPGYVAAGFDPWISHAPALFIPTVSEQIYHRRYQEPDKLEDDGTEIDWPIPYWWTDVGATALLIHQAAINEGLVAGFLGLEDYSELKEYL